MILLLATAQAATLSVGSTGYATVTEAVDAASSGDRIEIDPGTYPDECLDSAGKDLDLAGTDSADPPLITGLSGCNNLLVVQGGETVTLSDLSLTNDSARAIYAAGGSALSLDAVTVSDSGNWNGWPGAVYVTGATLTLTDSTLTGNTGSSGGSLYAVNATITVTDSALTDSSGWYGAAVFLDYGNTLTVTGSELSENWTYYTGGAIHADSDNVVLIEDSVFSGNSLYDGSGGALTMEWGDSLTITDTTFSDNTATYSGGAIYLYANDMDVDISGCTFTGNRASYYYGGAIHSEWYADLDIRDSEFTDNVAYYNGGAVGVWYDSHLEISDSSFTGNTAGYGPGGALSFYDGDQSHSLWIADSAFSENTAYSDGGAIDLSWVDIAEVSGSTFDANNAGADSLGGALDVYVANDLILEGNRFCLNEAGTGGAVVAQWVYETDRWTNNAFVENTATTGGAAYRYAAYVGETVNNSFVGNRSIDWGGSYYAYYGYSDWRNNVVAHTASGIGIYAADAYSASSSSLAYGAWADNAPVDAAGYFSLGDDEGHVLADDLGFIDWSQDGDCTNDDLRPAVGSPLIDAGDPDIEDPDGSISDIGLSGGPDAAVLDLDGDGHDTLTDCDDADPEVSPEADELCDGIDNDCDDEIDEDALDASTWYADADGDGFGDPDLGTTACDEASGWVSDDTDCDDADPLSFPGADEVEDDGIDQDCDGEDTVGAQSDSGTSEDDQDDQDDQDQAPSGDEASGGCGCGTVDQSGRMAPGLLALLTLLSLVGRRRRCA